MYLIQLLHDFRLDPGLYDPALLYGDDQGSIALSKNPKFHGAKHIRVHYHLIRDLKIELKYKLTSEMITDSLIKALPRPAGVHHRDHREEMGLRPGSLPNVSTSGSARIDETYPKTSDNLS